MGPVTAKHSAAEAVDFAKRGGLHPGPFEAEREAAYSREQIEDFVSRSGEHRALPWGDACCIERICDTH